MISHLIWNVFHFGDLVLTCHVDENALHHGNEIAEYYHIMRVTCTQSMFLTLSSQVNFMKKTVNEAGRQWEKMTVTQEKEKTLRLGERTAWGQLWASFLIERWWPQRIQHFLRVSKAGNLLAQPPLMPPELLPAMTLELGGTLLRDTSW